MNGIFSSLPCLALMVTFSLSLPLVAHAAPDEFVVGGDVSFLARIEQLCGVYKDKGRARDALEIFKSRGANLMRLRLWVNPDGKNMNVSDLPYTLALAKRIKQDGFKLLLDIHYSDEWADPGKQTKPAAWKDLDFAQLTKQVEDYSREVITKFRENDAMPDMVQIGNETPNGMLWPDGKVKEPHGWVKYGTLVKAGIKGVKEGAAPLPAPQTMLHINNGAEVGLATWFFDNLKFQQQGIDFDVIGLSFYPGPKARLAMLRQSLATIAEKYHKPIIIAEVGYPAGWVEDKEKGDWEFPTTPEGQKAFLQALIQTVREVPHGLGRGVVWWEPEWVGINGLGQYYGSKMLFDTNFNALLAMDALTARR